MSPERWQQIEEVFQAVVDLSAEERRAYLAARHAADRDLIAEIERLIADYEEAGDFIESPVWTDSFMLGATTRNQIGGALDAEIRQEKGSLIGRRLGVYLLTEELGRGGMGAVYLAERADGEFRRRVALKVIKRGMDTDFIIRRFRNERQILATLDHPNIARLLDGGTTDDGLPFFVMEYIEGAPVYRFSDAKRLSIPERLQLFTRICEAVEYAHENLIIHRDIKPTNILVTGDGVPKLLDFGIAKILDPELAADSIDPTATAMRMMTPEYASPEQVRGEAVTRASDIYSLGVLLYELLTGHRPYRLKNRALHEIARVICEEEPDTLASSLTRGDNFVPTGTHDEKTTLEAIFESRRGSRDSLRRELSGDLERIVFKALRKAPADRYATARELAEDIARYLGGEPVRAPEYFVPPAARAAPPRADGAHELSVAVLPFKLFGATPDGETGDDYLCIGLADALITRLSNVRRLIVRPTSSVLKYGSADAEPITAGGELGVGFVVDGNIRRVGSRLRVTAQLLNIGEGAARWAEKFDEEFTDVLTLEDSISEKIAEALLPQLTGDERDQLKKRGTNSALAFEHYLHGRHYWNSFTEDGFAKAIVAYYQAIAHDPNYALAYAGIADYHNWLGIYGVLPSKECFQSAVENARQAIALDPELGEAYASLAFAQHGGFFEWDESEENFRKSLRLNPNVAETHVWYSIKLTTEGRFAEGIGHAARAVELDPQTPFNQHNLGWVLYYARHFEQSREQYRKAAAMFPEYPLAHYGLAWVERHLGRFDAAVEAADRAHELMRDSVFALHVQAQTFAAAGRREQAAAILEKLERLGEKQFVSAYHSALVYAYLDEPDRALALLEKCAETSEAWLVWLGVEPAFDALRDAPRFRAVLDRTRNPLLERAAETPAEKPNPTLAVLPFGVMSAADRPTDDDRFLGIGLADALVTRLSSVKRLVVRPTNSVVRSGRRTADPFAVAAEVNAAFVVDGHVKRVGERLRVSVQLLDCAARKAVWAQSFDEDFTDVLTLEDRVSEQIAAALLTHLTDDEKARLGRRPTDNAKAFEAYIRGRYHWNSFTEEGLQKSLGCYREALEDDPDFALAYAGIADYHNFLCIFGSKAPILSFPAAKEAARRAIELDPQLAEGYVALGVAAFGYDWDFAEGERLLKKALELNPNYAVAHFWHAQILSLKGDHERALRAMRRAEQLSPGIPSLLVIYAFTYRNARRFDAALEKIREALALQPNYYVGVQGFGWVVKWTKNFDEAEAITKECVERTGRLSLPLYAYGYVLATRGKTAEARAILREIEARRAAHYLPAVYLALIYTELGDFDRAFEWLEKSFDEREFWAIWLPVDPRFDALRRDRRYRDLVGRLNPAGEGAEIHESHIATKILPPAAPETEPKTEPETEPETAPRRPAGRRKLYAAAAAIAALGLAIVFFFQGFRQTPGGDEPTLGANPTANAPAVAPAAPAVKTIVVLPFETDADAENEESYGLGLPEAVFQKLRQVRELSMGLVFLKLKTPPTPAELVQNYGASYVLRGRLHIADGRLKVDAELVGAADGKVLWLEKFDESAADFQNLQTAISERVLKALTIELSAGERREIARKYTENNEAYQVYLVGRYQLSNRTADDLQKAVRTFEKARALDPNFALAYAGLADAYALLNRYVIPPPPDAYAKSKQNALRAIELDPNLAEAHAALGYVLFYHERRREDAVAALTRAIELNPAYSQAYHWLALMLSAMNRHDEAVRHIKKAIELEPRSAIIQTTAGLVYFYARNYAEALATADRVLENNEGFVPAYKTKRVVYEATGNYSAALSAYRNERVYSENTDEDDEGWLMIAAQVQAVGGQREEALTSLRRAGENPFVKNNPTAFAYEIAVGYALAGETAAALEWLERARAAKVYDFNFAAVDPRLDNLRGDARLAEILAR